MVEAGHRVVACGEPDCCCVHVPLTTDGNAQSSVDELERRPSIDVLSQRVKAALVSEDIGSFADLLDPAVHWGAPDDPTPSCQSRAQVLRE